MEDEQSNASQSYKTFVRPSWPYEEWREVQRKIELEDENGQIAHAVPSHDDEEAFEPDHWADDLSAPVDNNVPLCHLLHFMEPELNGGGNESNEILEEMTEMMRKTTEKLHSCCLVFENCYIIPVGSMAENTKIGKADEFDYAVVLPYFKTFDKLFPIIFQKDQSLLYSDPAYVALANDMAMEGKTKDIQENFQAALKCVWSLYMVNFIPEGWELHAPEWSCHGAEHGIARTFHLNRLSDGFLVDIDICFWTPIHKSTLAEKGDHLDHKNYLLENCLDNEMKLFAILPTDRNLDYSTNMVRFAMSVKESEALNKYGPNNGRIQCYRLAKCIAKYFIPNIQKKKNCSRCLECLVSSYALKNIVLYMANNYPDDKMWTKEQLGNRVCEVFAILNFCTKINFSQISAFFTPYIIKLRTLSEKYDSANGVLEYKDTGWSFNKAEDPLFTEDPISKKGVQNDSADGVLEDKDTGWSFNEAEPCFLPEMKMLDPLFTEDPISKKVLQNYFCFLHESDWSVPEVVDRLNETLTAFMESEESERKEYANNPGCLCFQPYSASDFAVETSSSQMAEYDHD